MPKRPTRDKTRAETPRRLARARALPGLEDRTIRPLEDLAAEYAEIRDHRMELTKREAALKSSALALMKKLDRAVYRHNGVEIVVVPGEDDVKVKVGKAPALDPVQTEARRQAIDAPDFKARAAGDMPDTDGA